MKRIYFNGNIVTMESALYAPAVLTDGGSISKIGTAEELFSSAPDAEKIDLHGKTMLPAFIDA
ncbi:MAG: amidohydrolase, partial [Oscillospiraceae bacterium]